MKLLAVQRVALSVDFNLFHARDVWCDAGDDNESYQDAQGRVAGASTYQISVPASSYPPRTGLELRVWAGEPEPDDPVRAATRDGRDG
ncbi:hypothetical protein [Micromonospora sp. DT31]|uniref:hypothetical protein n=1 Tax=Micromonospora sp. DT31 TaxID=3393434 RepID=UPI003CF8803F